jgi:predicted Zn-dependent peptidase
MYQVFKLDNGIRVALKKMNELRSVSFGVWIDAGSANEDKEYGGISHLIEHMLFKGTSNRSAKEIVTSIENIGGELNAFTSKECTCYYAKVLDTHLDIAMDVISDMILNPLFLEEEIEKEKLVIYDEIDMYDDNPEEVCYDLSAELTYGENHYGNPILGKKSTIEEFNREKVIKYFNDNYKSDNIVISIAGNFKVEDVKRLLNQYFNTERLLKSSESNMIEDEPEFASGCKSIYKDTEQLHISIAFKGFKYQDKRLYPLVIVDNYLGSSASSKLFQNIREKHGLAYGIYSFTTQYKEAGIFNIYFSIKKENAGKVLSLVMEEIEKLKNEYIDDDSIKRLKEQIKGSYILELESPLSFMEMMGKALLVSDYIKTEEEILTLIDNVKTDDVKDVIKQVFNKDMMNMSIVGNVTDDEAQDLWRIIND